VVETVVEYLLLQQHHSHFFTKRWELTQISRKRDL